MKFQVSINSINTVDQIETYWTTQDYVALLEKFDYPDAEKADRSTLRELLLMAITDFEPTEAAAILLEYKLSDQLNEGQIQQISNDMQTDKISEEYPEIGLQSTLFHINQLLFKAYNGKFPNAKASVITGTIEPQDSDASGPVTKEMFLKLLSSGLADGNIIKRLFDDAMNQQAPFPEAEDIIWELSTQDNRQYRAVTSEYWLKQEDFTATAFEASVEETAGSEA